MFAGDHSVHLDPLSLAESIFCATFCPVARGFTGAMCARIAIPNVTAVLLHKIRVGVDPKVDIGLGTASSYTLGQRLFNATIRRMSFGDKNCRSFYAWGSERFRAYLSSRFDPQLGHVHERAALVYSQASRHIT